MKDIKLKSGHTLIIRSVQKEDASNMLNYLKVIGGESDNLLFGPEGVPMTLEQEEKFLESASNNTTFPMFVGLVDQNIVSVINASGSTRERVAHLAEIGISVLKAYWHQGIGRHMMTYLIDHVKKIGTVNTLHLRVRTDNINAISLYQSMGFEIIGTFHHHTRIQGVYYDVYIMEYML